MGLPFKKEHLVASGKAKSMYASNDVDFMVMEFRDDVSAFDGEKTTQLVDKGYVNNIINAFIMQHLQAAGIDTCFHSTMSDNESLVYRLAMLPIECVVRNVAAGSLCRRLGVEQGTIFDNPLFEFFLKDDDLHDPLITVEHILAFDWATPDEISLMKERSLAVNEVLSKLFFDAGLTLVDFKLEFGWFNGEVFMLGDEFSPDGCRLWDLKTGESFDKDRFRKDEGDVIEFYKEVASRLGVPL